MGIEQDPAKHTQSHTRFQRGSSSIRRRFRTDGSVEAAAGFCSTPIAGVSFVATPQVKEEENDAVESDFYLLAKSYFDCQEYRRAAHVLWDQTSKKAAFLRCYALYLVIFFDPSFSFWWLIKCFMLLILVGGGLLFYYVYFFSPK